MLIYKAVYPDNVPGSYALSPEETEEALQLGTRRLMDVLELLRECQSRARVSTDRRIDAQLCIMNMAMSAQSTDGSLSERVQRLEERLNSGDFAAPAVPRKPVEKQSAPAPKEELPPWDDTPRQQPKPIVRESQKAEPEQVRQQPKPETETAGVPPVSNAGFDWLDVLERAKDKLSNADYMTMQLPSMLTAAMVGDTLYLSVKSLFLIPRLEDSRTQSILKEASGAKQIRVNEPVPVQETLPKKEDPFEKLLSLEGKFDQIQFE